jgi:hypothetical protein
MNFVRPSAFLILFGFLNLALSPTAEAQTYSAGAVGSIIYSGGSGSSLSNFGTWGAHGFLEWEFEPGTRVGMRGGSFGLPGTTETSPNLRVDDLQFVVTYVFKDAFADVGFSGGSGIFRIRPREPEAGQIATDPDENRFGLTVGLVSLFHLSRRWDLRLEGTLHYIFSDDRKSPIFIGGGLAYNF